MTTTFGHRFRFASVPAEGTVMRTMPASLALLGALTILISAWGAIIPYVGPSFGYRADGAPSWNWTLSHAVLALVPGVIGILVGIAIWARSSNLSIGGGRIGLASAGCVALVCGAWFVIGPFAWPVIDSTHSYFVAASPLRLLANLIGYSLGPGMMLVACGAFALGWAVRHQRPLEAATAVPTGQPLPRRRFARRDPRTVPPTEPASTEAPPTSEVPPTSEGPPTGASTAPPPA